MARLQSIVSSLVLCCVTSSTLCAVDNVAAKGEPLPPDASEAEVLAGHSYHGEFLNEGPRQSAYLMEGTGTVRFPVTSDSDEAKAFVAQGLGQFYGFWFLESERSFRHAASLDPDCAMAYWGAALATKKNRDRARGFIGKATELKDKTTKRERMYIESLEAFLTFKSDDKKSDDKEKPLSADDRKKRAEEYTEALESLALEFPEDVEAKALLALQLYENKRDLPNPSYLAVDGLLDKVFEVEPNHSAHHFRIHLWDHKKAEVALQSAALCGPASPAIAHMWHMPGHIYSRLKRYNDAAWQQEASARVDHAHMMRDRVMPDEIHNFAHNNEWLIRNLINVGRAGEAVDLAKNMIQLPRHPRYNTLEKRGSAYYGRLRLMESLRVFELWEQATELCGTAYLEPTEREKEQVNRLRLLGVASVNLGRDLAADRTQRGLEKRLETQRSKQTKAGDAAAKRAEEKARGSSVVTKAVDRAKKSAEEKFSEEEEDREKKITEFVDAARKKSQAEQVKKASKTIAKARSDARKPFATPINDLVKAIAEIETHRAVKADDFPRALKEAKKASRGISPQMMAHILLNTGDPKAAIEKAKREADRKKGEVFPLASLVELYLNAGHEELARESLKELQKIGAVLDASTSLHERITKIAVELGIGESWQQNADAPKDLGDRPDLDSLGPFRWSPSTAPEWSLTDADGQPRSLGEYRGKPVIVIFYLGYGCLHCAEQLQAFAPINQKFADAGIEILAISSDDLPGLKKSIELYDGEKFPFPLISDESLDVFKRYRAFDDFEQQPLHGTYLIDAEGRVRWQDIGFEPFMDPEFLLGESKRLLASSGE